MKDQMVEIVRFRWEKSDRHHFVDFHRGTFFFFIEVSNNTEFLWR